MIENANNFTHASFASSKYVRVPPPPYRRLRAFAFDPILSRQIETYDVNEVTIRLPWDDSLGLGPTDGYIEVMDVDPTLGVFYAPVDLNDPRILAADGLPPSEGNPQFHQQMVYAVARTTIAHFERALGRKVLWSPRRKMLRREEEDKDQSPVEEPVKRLRIYPHAMRDKNAYYSPAKKALLFGYFPASADRSGQNMPGEIVFTCLSHDIVAHETTHAIVDGLHPRFMEPSNIDVLALHEALADIVALFQHFTYPDVLRHQIAKTRGDLERQNLLGELAFQFGQAIGNYGALRNAIGDYIDPEMKEWRPKRPDPTEMQKASEPHNRGAILIASIFAAFLKIYRHRVRNLMRIATGGTGVLPLGDIHPDLADRLAEEASKTAGHILQICIRALDYSPPVDISFGDYLRAIITADAELVTDDPFNYRLAIIDAFRERGIYPKNIRNLSIESLIWHKPSDEEQKAFKNIFAGIEELRGLVSGWSTSSDRTAIFYKARDARRLIHDWFTGPGSAAAARAAHIAFEKRKGKYSIYMDRSNERPSLEVHSARPARRYGPDGQTVTELVIEMTQRRRGYFNPETQKEVDDGTYDSNVGSTPDPDFIFRGGCTLLVDPVTTNVRFCIYKDIMSDSRLERMRNFLLAGGGPSLQSTYFGDPRREYFLRLMGRDEHPQVEPFMLLHRLTNVEEDI